MQQQRLERTSSVVRRVTTARTLAFRSFVFATGGGGRLDGITISADSSRNAPGLLVLLHVSHQTLHLRLKFIVAHATRRCTLRSARTNTGEIQRCSKVVICMLHTVAHASFMTEEVKIEIDTVHYCFYCFLPPSHLEMFAKSLRIAAPMPSLLANLSSRNATKGSTKNAGCMSSGW